MKGKKLALQTPAEKETCICTAREIGSKKLAQSCLGGLPLSLLQLEQPRNSPTSGNSR